MNDVYLYYIFVLSILSFIIFYNEVKISILETKINLIRNMMSKNVVVGIIIIIALLAYFLGFMMYNNIYLLPIFEEYKQLDTSTKVKYWGLIIFQLAGLFLTAYILKFLLGMKQFKDSIKDIFIEIFSEHKFLKGIDKESLLKIAKNVTSANSDIKFDDKSKDNESVTKLKRYFENNKEKNENKNYMVIYSAYKTTLLSNGYEIMHRKIICKILKEGKFEFKFRFTAPDDNKNLKFEDYKNARKKNRFNETSYDSFLRSSSIDDGFNIHEEFSLEKEFFKDYKGNPENAVKIVFSKIQSFVDEIITLEFSITHKFNLKSFEEIEDYYNSTYSYPHAIRNITFQQERYDCEKKVDNIPVITPVMYSTKDNIIKGHYEENIYYKSYNWDIFYSLEDSEKVSLRIK